jgi:5'-deoxynucleotidase YfbR-like HD superfamily hydrolase
MIRKAMLLKLLDAAYMQRWNDKIRPVELIELDKQAHKMIVAYFLARVEEDSGTRIVWQKMVEAGIFELLQRIVITDLKPQIFYKIKADTKKYRQLNEWVYGELRQVISSLGKPFCRRYQDHFLEKDGGIEQRILDAAHFYATRWEFQIVARSNPGGYEIDDIRADLDRKLEAYGDLPGMALLSSEGRFRNFIDLCGQLRFQARWAHLYRIPKTSVLGHSLYVGILSYLFSLEIKACPRRAVNNFLTGLFHDLPEVLTRDIISPVKRSVEGLSELIKGYEKEMLDKEVYGLLPEGWHAEFAMFAEHEFENFVTVDGKAVEISPAELHERYNEEAYNPKDGELVKRADQLAAFVEAYAGIRNGSTSQDLQYAKAKIREREEDTHYLGLNFGEIYSDFD